MSVETRIIVVTSRLDIGGTERHLTRVLPLLRRRGIDVALYVMEQGGALESELSACGVRIEGPPRYHFMHWPRATLHLARFLRSERPDIVHFFLPRPYIYGSIAAELAGQSGRLMSRRSLANYRTRHPLAHALERLLHRRCVGLVGNSRAVVQQLSAECGQPQKVALLYNGIEIGFPTAASDRQEARRILKIPQEAIVLTVVANLIPYKGHCDLIEALGRISSKLPRPWLCFMIGRDCGIGAELKAQAKSLQIAGNIMWLGEQKEVNANLRASDMFVLPSHEEGFSNALLEAMGNGIAVIATAVGGNLDAVIENESGLLVDPGDLNSLAEKILRLAEDAVLRNRLGAAARERVERHFSLQHCVGCYEALYRAVREKQPRPIRDVLAAGPVRPSVRAKPPASAHPR